VQRHRIRFSKNEIASGAVNRFWLDGLLPAAIDLDRRIDLTTVAVFDADDSEGGKSLYLSPAASFAFLAVAQAHVAQPCDRPASKACFSPTATNGRAESSSRADFIASTPGHASATVRDESLRSKELDAGRAAKNRASLDRFTLALGRAFRG